MIVVRLNRSGIDQLQRYTLNSQSLALWSDFLWVASSLITLQLFFVQEIKINITIKVHLDVDVILN